MSWHACYSAATSPEAHLVKGFLEHRGVPCLLRSAGPTGRLLRKLPSTQRGDARMRSKRAPLARAPNTDIYPL